MARDVPFRYRRENVFRHTSFPGARDVSCHKEEMRDQFKRVPYASFQTRLKHAWIRVFYSVPFHSSEKKEYFTTFFTGEERVFHRVFGRRRKSISLLFPKRRKAAEKKEYFTAFSPEKKEYFTAFPAEKRVFDCFFPERRKEYFTTFFSSEKKEYFTAFSIEEEKYFTAFSTGEEKSILPCWLKTLFYLEMFLL